MLTTPRSPDRVPDTAPVSAVSTISPSSTDHSTDNHFPEMALTANRFSKATAAPDRCRETSRSGSGTELGPVPFGVAWLSRLGRVDIHRIQIMQPATATKDA